MKNKEDKKCATCKHFICIKCVSFQYCNEKDGITWANENDIGCEKWEEVEE